MINREGGVWTLAPQWKYRIKYYSLMTELSIGDIVVFIGNGIRDGIVVSISMKTVVVYDGAENFPVKWCNIMEIKEKSFNKPK